MAAKNKKTANMSAVRQALGKIRKYAVTARDHSDNQQIAEDAMMGIIETIDAALAKPRRNCDVGTPEEQLKRQYDTMCNTTKACPDSDWACKKCFAIWAQMPYDPAYDMGD